MGYLLRFDAPGALHHVWARGVGPCRIFLDAEDYLAYLVTAARYAGRLEATCLQYCLMPTHVHLLVRTRDASLSALMQRIHSQYARSFNGRYERSGHLFSERFGSRWIQTQEDLLGVVRYVALNPVDLDVRPEEWSWSSYRTAVAGADDPFAANAEILRLVGGPDRLRALVEDGLAARLRAAA